MAFNIYKSFLQANSSTRFSFIGSALGAIISLFVSIITMIFTYENTKKQILESKKSSSYSEFLNDVKYCVSKLNNAYLWSSNMMSISRQITSSLKPIVYRSKSKRYFKSLVINLHRLGDYNKKIIIDVNDIKSYIQLMNLNYENKELCKIMVSYINADSNVCKRYIRSKIISNFIKKYLNLFKEHSKCKRYSFNVNDKELKIVSNQFDKLIKGCSILSKNISKLCYKLLLINKLKQM